MSARWAGGGVGWYTTVMDGTHTRRGLAHTQARPPQVPQARSRQPSGATFCAVERLNAAKQANPARAWRGLAEERNSATKGTGAPPIGSEGKQARMTRTRRADCSGRGKRSPPPAPRANPDQLPTPPVCKPTAQHTSDRPEKGEHCKRHDSP